MKALHNPARERLVRGELAIGVGIRHSRNVAIAKIMKTAGYDFLFIDLEHSTMPPDTAAQICLAALNVGVAPLVRVPARQNGFASQILNGGAMGVIMPGVETVDEAREIVAHQKFPPLGHRSAGGALAQFDYARVDMDAATSEINRQSLVTVMLESERGIANAEAIAAVDGVDVLMIGAGDLTAQLGLSGQPGHPKIVAAFEAVTEACRRHGKWAGMGGVEAEDVVARYVELGVRFILYGNDINLMIAGGQQKTRYLRNCGTKAG